MAKLAGFSLHAGTVCEAHQRSKLERLCRYITRPPIATKRLNWRYNYQPVAGSAEAELNAYLEPRDWLGEAVQS